MDNEMLEALKELVAAWDGGPDEMEEAVKKAKDVIEAVELVGDDNTFNLATKYRRAIRALKDVVSLAEQAAAEETEMEAVHQAKVVLGRVKE